MTRHQNVRLNVWAACAGVLALASLGLARADSPEGPTGKVQQGLVGGQEVSESEQERLGLLSLDIEEGSCSASLLRNDWVITAAHCVEAEDAAGDPIPDPDRPGQNTLVRIQNVKLTALWGNQKREAWRIETFRPYDIALIQVSPFAVNNRKVGYVRQIFQGAPKGVEIRAYGRGINEFATGSGDTAVPSKMDGKFRVATFTVSRERDTTYRYATEAGDMIAGGDSGGPAFNSKDELVGVHSTSSGEYIMGKPREWDWATKATSANDAPVAPVWRQLAKIMGPVPPSTLEPDEKPEETGRHKAMFEELGFRPGPGSGKVEENILYGVRGDNGDLIWHKHWIDFRPGQDRHKFAPTKKVGDGWKAGYKGAYPAGNTWIYTLSDAGALRLHRHLGAFDGSYKWREPSLEVATGWGDYKQIIPTDHGVVYQLTKLGVLRWTNYWDYENPRVSGAGAWFAPRNAPGLWPYLTVFSGGNGVLYGVHIDGRLMWHKHVDYKKGGETWLGPKQVGEGWNGFTKIFSPGEGHIYAVLENGDLMYYRHTAWETGEYTWDENIKGKIASGWNGYASAFARSITGDPEEIDHPN